MSLSVGDKIRFLRDWNNNPVIAKGTVTEIIEVTDTHYRIYTGGRNRSVTRTSQGALYELVVEAEALAVGDEIRFITAKTWANGDITPLGTTTTVTNINTDTGFLQVNVSGGIRNISLSQEGTLFEKVTPNQIDTTSILYQIGQAVKEAGLTGGGGDSNRDTGVQSYTTEELPDTASNGTIAYDTTISAHVYFQEGRWLLLSDDSVVADRVIEVYILSGQSNAGGTGSVSNLSGYTQLDSNGTLGDTRTDILFSNNHSSDQSGTPGSYTPSGSHGVEASFLDGINHVRTKKQFLVKYYSGGSSIDTWDKTQSVAVLGSGDRNNWDKLTTSIDNAISWASTNGYTIEWKGFVWWQGESDREPSNGSAKSEYVAKLQTLIENVRTHVNKSELPVCLIEVDNRIADDDAGSNSQSTSGMSEIQEAQSEVADADSNIQFIDVTQYAHLMDWSGPNSGGKYDGVHWQSEAYVRIGYDVATRMDDIIEGNLTYVPTNPLLWLDASDESTITHNNMATKRVSQWNDKSGNGHHAIQPTGSKQLATGLLTVNGLNAIKMESGGRDMYCLTPASANWQDTYIVSRWDGATEFNDFVGLFTGTVNTGSDNGIQGRRDTKNLYGKGWGDNLFINGVESEITDVLPTLASTFLMSLSANYPVGVNGYCVGNDRRLGHRNWRGPICEIISFDRKLPDTEKLKIEGYLAHKWGIASVLPANHPYKVTAP